MKTLLLKPSSLGDVVQALPVLRLLKAHRPQEQIYWWISADLAPLLEDDPDLAGLVLFERRKWGSPRQWPRLLADLAAVRAARFDRVIDLQGLLRSGVFAWLFRGEVTVGLQDLREGAPAFYDYAVDRPSRHTHAVDWYLRVLPLLGAPVHWDFEWLPVRQAARRRVLPLRPPGVLIALHPGARWDNKRWPVESYRELARLLLARRPDLRFAVLGGSGDAGLARSIAEAAPAAVLDLTGRTTLPEMIEWLRVSDLVVTNDTGPMHVAAALGKRVVALFGPTDPTRTGPYRMQQDVLRTNLPCVPCMRDRCSHPRPLACLLEITPARVAAAVVQRLGC